MGGTLRLDQMPLLKPSSERIRNPPTSNTSRGGQDLLKVYKHFPSNDSIGYYITYVLMDSSYIWYQKTLLGPALGIPKGMKERKWRIQNRTDNIQVTTLKWLTEGWIVSKKYRSQVTTFLLESLTNTEDLNTLQIDKRIDWNSLTPQEKQAILTKWGYPLDKDKK